MRRHHDWERKKTASSISPMSIGEYRSKLTAYHLGAPRLCPQALDGQCRRLRTLPFSIRPQSALKKKRLTIPSILHRPTLATPLLTEDSKQSKALLVGATASPLPVEVDPSMTGPGAKACVSVDTQMATEGTVSPDPTCQGTTSIAKPHPPQVNDTLSPTPLGKVSQPSQNPTLHG